MICSYMGTVISGKQMKPFGGKERYREKIRRYDYVWDSLAAQWYRIHLPMQECRLHASVRRSIGEGNVYLLQDSCLGSPMDREA